MRLNTNPVPHVTETKDGQLLVGTWRHGEYAGGEEPKYISPLGTKLHFHTNDLRKILFYWPLTWPPCHMIANKDCWKIENSVLKARN